MSMKMVCNRCNKVKEDGETFDRIDYTVKSVNPYKDFTYDLCPECSKQFGIFMDGGEVEEDHYKDSKPCSVVIHKLANGNYGIESMPDGKKKNHCGTCAYQWDAIKCPRAGKTPGAIGCENDAECCDEWVPAVEPSIDKEESDLSVDIHTNAAGITVPDSEPWGRRWLK